MASPTRKPEGFLEARPLSPGRIKSADEGITSSAELARQARMLSPARIHAAAGRAGSKSVTEARPLSRGRIKSADCGVPCRATCEARPLSRGRVMKASFQERAGLPHGSPHLLGGGSACTSAAGSAWTPSTGIGGSLTASWGSSGTQVVGEQFITSAGVTHATPARAKTLTAEEAQELNAAQRCAGTAEVARTITSKPTWPTAGASAARVLGTSRFLQNSDGRTSPAVAHNDGPMLHAEAPFPSPTPSSGAGCSACYSAAPRNMPRVVKEDCSSRPFRSRSTSPSRNCTPRRGRSIVNTVDCNPMQVPPASSFTPEPRVTCVSRGGTKNSPTVISSTSASPGLSAGSMAVGNAVGSGVAPSFSPSVVVGPGQAPSLGGIMLTPPPTFAAAAPSRAASSMSPGLVAADGPRVISSRGTASRGISAHQSSSPSELGGGKSIECSAMFMQRGRCWKFAVHPDISVTEAVSTATNQVLRSFPESDRRLGERLQIQVLPATTDTSSVGEWASKNSDQPPTILIRSLDNEDNGYAMARPQMDATTNIQGLMEEQTRLMLTLQRQVNEQTAIIRNQASYISDLQDRERRNADTIGKAVERIEAELIDLKTHVLGLEDQLCGTANGSQQKAAS